MDSRRFRIQGDDAPLIAVAIRRNRSAWCNLHTGILYRDVDNTLHTLHLAWHNTLKDEPFDGTYACAIPLLDPADEIFLASYCGRVGQAEVNQKIPYNLRNDPDSGFDPETGELRLSATGTGLNCATFVMAVFRSSGNPLVNPDGWPEASSEDEEIQRGFVLTMIASQQPVEAEQGLRVQSEIGSPRFRPEHVAGACLEDELPVRFPECEVNGRHIVAVIDGQSGQLVHF